MWPDVPNNFMMDIFSHQVSILDHTGKRLTGSDPYHDHPLRYSLAALAYDMFALAIKGGADVLVACGQQVSDWVDASFELDVIDGKEYAVVGGHARCQIIRFTHPEHIARFAQPHQLEQTLRKLDDFEATGHPVWKDYILQRIRNRDPSLADGVHRQAFQPAQVLHYTAIPQQGQTARPAKFKQCARVPPWHAQLPPRDEMAIPPAAPFQALYSADFAEIARFEPTHQYEQEFIPIDRKAYTSALLTFNLHKRYSGPSGQIQREKLRMIMLKRLDKTTSREGAFQSAGGAQGKRQYRLHTGV